MKSERIKSGVFALLVAVFVPMSLLSQQQVLKLSTKTDGVDSLTNDSYFSTIFDVEDLGKMHEKLDSIFSTLDKDLGKKIRVMAFSNDSMFNNFDFDWSFKQRMDSLFSFDHFGMDENRIQNLIDSYRGSSWMHNWDWDDRYLDSLSREGMNIRMQTDSIKEDGKMIIKKQIIVEGTGENGEPIVIQRFNEAKGNSNNDIINYHNKDGVVQPGKNLKIEKQQKQLKPNNHEHKYVQKITISDAEILVKGGIAPKVITAPALKPKNIEVSIKVQEEFGKEIKTIGMSLDFDDKKDLQVLVLARDGQKIFEETLKKFSGTYHKDIEINEAISPYYFVVIRDKQMFGRLIHE